MTTTQATDRSRTQERREQLAISALATLGELGYARTSLREIAQNSEFSHGVVHYYFKDKNDLITYCIRYYKTQCATRYDEIVDTTDDPDDLRERFADKLVETMTTESSMHRLWYDLRTQAMFEPRLQAEVAAIDELLEQMIWRVVQRFADLAGREVGFDSSLCYATLDGLFQRALLRHLTGHADAAPALREGAGALLPHFLAPAPDRA